MSLLKVFRLIKNSLSNTPQAKGNVGELKTSLLLSFGKNTKNFIQFDDVTIYTSSNDTTQIDHVLISKHGIFVIEVKNYSGLIYGLKDDYQWTQVLNSQHKNHFYNPILQNKKHVQAISRCLKIHDKFIHSIIVFTGKSTFKTQMPDNVIYLTQLNHYLKQFQDDVLNEQEVYQFANLLKKHQLPKEIADKLHLKNLAKKQKSIKSDTQKTHQNNQIDQFCPKCGGKLVQRTAKKGKNIGNTFLGCDNFPKCQFSQNL